MHRWFAFSRRTSSGRSAAPIPKPACPSARSSHRLFDVRWLRALESGALGAHRRRKQAQSRRNHRWLRRNSIDLPLGLCDRVEGQHHRFAPAHDVEPGAHDEGRWKSARSDRCTLPRRGSSLVSAERQSRGCSAGALARLRNWAAFRGATPSFDAPARRREHAKRALAVYVRPNLGGHAEYLLRAFADDGAGGLTPAPLENTLDVARVRRGTPLFRKLLEWVNAANNLPAIDEATIVLPDELSARRVVSVTPRGMNRGKIGHFQPFCEKRICRTSIFDD